MFARQPRPLRQTGAKRVAKSSSESTPVIGIRNVQPGAPRKDGVFDPTSDLGRLLRTNLSPTDSQKEEMKILKITLAKEASDSDELAAQKRAAILQYENSIFRLREEVAELEQKARRARKDIACASSLLSPIRVLPSEIMGEIFVACLEKRVSSRAAEAPLLLCRVCSAWRAIARSTPALWSQLTISRPTSTFDSISRFITTWFSLAGDLPLSLSFVQSHNAAPSLLVIPQYTTQGNVPPVWGRIESLGISVPSWSSAQAIVENISGVLPAIKDLTIEFQWLTVDQESHGMLLPNLRRFSVSRLSLETRKSIQKSTNFPMPFVRLRRPSMAKLTHISMSQVIVLPGLWHSLFRNCHALEHGAFMLSGDQWSEELLDPITFPFLRTLEVVFVRNGNWSILKRFSFPALRSLCLGTVEGLSAWNEVALMNFQSRHLESLIFFKIKVRPEDLSNFLRGTPALQLFLAHLPLDYTPFLQDLSDFSIERESEDPEIQQELFLPDLRKLSIYHWRSINKKTDLNIRGIMDMIKARWSPRSERPTAPPGKRLEHVSVWTWRAGLKLDTLKSSLRRERKEGLILDVGVAPMGYRYDSNLDW